MLATLRQRDFSLLWFAGLVSLMGNWMLSVALKVTVYEMTGSVLAVGGMLLATTLPGILFSSVAGVFVDRWERRRTLIMTNLLLAGVILPLLLVRSDDWLWLVYVVSFAQSTLSHVFSPAENAMLPLLSNPKYLMTANALNALNNNLARLIGPAVGGLLVVLAGLEGVVILDALTYLVAAGLIGMISVTSHPGKDRAADVSFRKLVSEWTEGLRFIWRVHTLRTLLLLDILPAISESIMYVLFVPFVTEVLRGDAVLYGGLASAQAVGGLAGSLVIGAVAARVRPVRLLAIGALGIGVADLLLFNYMPFLPFIGIAFGLLIAAGPFAVGLGASYNTLVQTHVPDSHRGRVFGMLSLTNALFAPVGIAIASVASEHAGIVPIINFQAYAYLMVGVGALLFLRERVARVSPALSVE